MFFRTTLFFRIAACLALCLTALPAVAGNVGFSLITVPDGANPKLEVGVWYPTEAAPHPSQIGLFTQTVAPDVPPSAGNLPLVVMSHGNGGEFAGHSDTAYALAQAGFVVAAPTHTGDNYRDQSRALDVAGRARQISAVIDFMVAQWHAGGIDPERVGAFGFSSGGLTVLVAAGGNPDLSTIGPHCTAHPEFFDCRLVGQHRDQASPAALHPAGFPHNGRIRAVAVAAPALGFSFGTVGLAGVTQPVQLWRAADDVVLPAPFYADAVRQALPHAPDFHVVPGAGHFDFLAPCPAKLAQIAPPICTSAPGFDRTQFHATFNPAVVAFFQHRLGS